MSNDQPQLPKPTVMLPAFVDGVGEYEEPMFDSMSMREYGRARERAAYERARHIVRTYKVPVGNSAAGEMACEWTMEALKEIDNAILALGADK